MITLKTNLKHDVKWICKHGVHFYAAGTNHVYVELLGGGAEHDALAAHAYQMAEAELIVWAAQRYSADVRKVIIEYVEWINDRAAAIHAKLLAGETM